MTKSLSESILVGFVLGHCEEYTVFCIDRLCVNFTYGKLKCWP